MLLRDKLSVPPIPAHSFSSYSRFFHLRALCIIAPYLCFSISQTFTAQGHECIYFSSSLHWCFPSVLILHFCSLPDVAYSILFFQEFGILAFLNSTCIYHRSVYPYHGVRFESPSRLDLVLLRLTWRGPYLGTNTPGQMLCSMST